MKNKIRLFLDEDVHPDLALVLRKMGFDAVSTVETGRKGETDLSQLQFAVSGKRTIITFNVKDFVLLYNQIYSEGKKHSGIIVSSQLNFKETLKRLLKLLNHKSAKDIENTIEFLNSWK